MSQLFDFPNSNDCFTNVDIAGGLCYFLWDANYFGDCTITNNINGEITSAKRPLNEFEILIRDNKAISILNKVLKWNNGKKSLNDRVSSSKPFGIRGFYTPKKSGIPCYFTQRIGLLYADEKDITDNFSLLDKWKLLIPKSPIAGQTDFTKPVGFYYDGNTRIAKPGECCTETYIVAGAFDTEKEVISFKSYIFTKSVRFLLLQMVISQDVTKRCFSFIPDLENYKDKYTDTQLCKLWGITNEEWSYIDSRIQDVKPMAE
jgi:site-specific DNA-methyltransferase (adenine-specific)